MVSTLFFVPNTKGPISDNQVPKETTEDTLSEDGFRKKNLGKPNCHVFVVNLFVTIVLTVSLTIKYPLV